MGRKSKEKERRDQLISAFIECVLENGLEATTLEMVAAKAGVNRTIIRHYIGNRDALIEATVDYLTTVYKRALPTESLSGEPKRRVDETLRYLFEGEFVERPLEDKVIDLLRASSGDNALIRESLKEMYVDFEDYLFQMLRELCPNAPTQAARGTAFSIMCMAEAAVGMRDLGFAKNRRRLARNAAQVLVETLIDAK